jgi:uncharacterized protein
LRSAEKALCDSGPLVALVDRDDFAHQECRGALQAFGGDLVTTLPVLVEAFYPAQGQSLRRFLWELIVNAAVGLADISDADFPRMRMLMEKYADPPMDFADASLVVLAERLKLRRVFTACVHT